MKIIVRYSSLIASIVSIVALIIAGVKFAEHNYDVIAEGCVIAICLVDLFICAIYNVSKHKD